MVLTAVNHQVKLKGRIEHNLTQKQNSASNRLMKAIQDYSITIDPNHQWLDIAFVRIMRSNADLQWMLENELIFRRMDLMSISMSRAEQSRAAVEI